MHVCLESTFSSAGRVVKSQGLGEGKIGRECHVQPRYFEPQRFVPEDLISHGRVIGLSTLFLQRPTYLGLIHRFNAK